MNIWPYISFILVSALVLPFIEWCRWKKEFGEKDNLDKRVTVAIAVLFWLLVCWAFKLFHWQVFIFGISCLCIRGVFYDPALNLFMDRSIDKESDTTNSKTDHAERKLNINFIWQRILYAGAAISFAVLYELSKRA